MKDKKGFTLTELLAVIVLIGVILAIAVPSYQSYVTRTRKEVLKSYQENIIDAANQYAAECIVKNTLVENFNKDIWKNLKFKNKDDIKKDYNDIKVSIKSGKSKASDLYCIEIQYTNTKNDSITYNNCSGEDGASTPKIIIRGKEYEENTSPIIKGDSLEITGKIEKIEVNNNNNIITIDCETTGIQTARSTCHLPDELEDGEYTITYGDDKSLKFIIDKTSPEIETSNINTSPTNTVEFTVTITDEYLKSVKKPDECKIEEDKEKIKRYTCTITENGRYSFSATDKVDNIETKDITISNITSEKPSVILNIDSEAVSKSKIIEIEYISGSNGKEIGFNTDQKLRWSLINPSNNQEETKGEFTNLSNKGSQKVEINKLTGTYSFIVEGLTNKAGNKNDKEILQIRLDNTPPSAAVVSKPSKDEEKTKSVECGGLDSNGNRECKVVFYGGFLGAEVKAKLNFTVEDIGGSEVGKVYYRTTTTGNFTETTVEAINNLKHKDFNKEQLNLYIEVVFADALGNIDYTKNITKITFVKN